MKKKCGEGVSKYLTGVERAPHKRARQTEAWSNQFISKKMSFDFFFTALK
jgi:hypothetical protein